jgi:putative nucleotidyltransferase with HDIG domain
MNETFSKLDLYFTQIHLKKLYPNSIINFDLYIKTGQTFILYKNSNLMIDNDDLERLKDRSIKILYIHKKDKKNFRSYLEVNLKCILESEEIPLDKKAEALQESAINVVEDIFRNPRAGETIMRSKEIIDHTVDFIIGTPKSFANFLEIRKYDYCTYTHSVNVCIFMVSLARELGIDDKKTLKAVGEGGLLHDLGKSRIPSSIINKRGRLVKGEWEIIKKHPLMGKEIAMETREIDKISLTIIEQHHEKPSGQGYPHGLNGSELDVFTGMASIADVYDAITTNRPYSTAKSPMEAAQILLENKQEYNEGILLKFLDMLAVKR